MRLHFAEVLVGACAIKPFFFSDLPCEKCCNIERTVARNGSHGCNVGQVGQQQRGCQHDFLAGLGKMGGKSKGVFSLFDLVKVQPKVLKNCNLGIVWCKFY